MEQLIWNDSLSVGIPEIDKDHQRLIDLLNDLIQSVAENKESEEMEIVLEELLSYTLWHFRHEERLMQTYEYDGFMEHKNEHASLLEQAVNLQNKFKAEGEGITPEVLDFLKEWVTKHILGTDMQMAKYLQSEM
ncbi:MAG: hemerythrin family protein [Magnetococcales bacterium]|nr:hemerythrin family protein [Magnetococcales bacterium]